MNKNTIKKRIMTKLGALEVDQWADLLAQIRLLYLFYQTAHWLSKGNDYYGDHLLFQRLYEETNAEIDPIAERAVGTTGEKTVDLNKSLEMMTGATKGMNGSFEKQALFLEHKVIATLETLDQKANMSVGTRNMLNDLADKHETHVYLLQQRTK